MAVYTKVSRDVPSSQRAALITNVIEGDRIDLTDVLGRPARKVIFHMTDSADEVEYKINHMRKLRPQRTHEEALTDVDRAFGVFGKDVETAWLSNTSTFSGTGSSNLETQDGLDIASLEIISLTLSVGYFLTISVT